MQLAEYWFSGLFWVGLSGSMFLHNSRVRSGAVVDYDLTVVLDGENFSICFSGLAFSSDENRDVDDY